jgi:rubrerythrin
MAESMTRAARQEPTGRFPGDQAILNVALGLEHEAIAAYEAGAKSGLLTGAVLETAASFLRDHQRHRDAIVALLRRLGGTPVAPKASYDFGPIATAADVLALAHKLEQGAADAYLANAAKLESAAVLDAAAGILVDEARHATALKLALSLPVTVRPTY